MYVRVSFDGCLRVAEQVFSCVLGKNGVIDATQKREGDGRTPIGIWPMRQVFYRPDRIAAPQTQLPVIALKPDDGWCDAPNDPSYNQLVKLPYKASAEALWREDHVYDILVVLGHNDRPVVPFFGSAIFMHLTRPDRRGTEGCVALDLLDLLSILREASERSLVHVEAAA